MALPFFTIGHSNRSLPEFLELLEKAQVQRIVDVRKMPASRANPQFGKDPLADALAEMLVPYEHIAALGGYRGKAPNLPPDVNGFWENKSFRNYADYALSRAFHEGLDRLIEEGRHRQCAIMCSEAVWWRCHRRLIADNLIPRGEAVFHIKSKSRVETARMTSGAVVRSDKTLIYPQELRSAL